MNNSGIQQTITSFFLRQIADKESSDLPALMALAERAATNILSGDHALRKPGTGEKFWQYREYDPSDRPQDIDWRMSARTDKVYTRQKEWQSTQSGLFWVQSSESMQFKSNKTFLTKKENGIVLALGLANLLIAAHEKVGLLSGAISPGGSDQKIHNIAEELIRSHTDTLPSVDYKKINKNSTFIILGDFLDPIEIIEKKFIEFSTRTDNVIIFQILDPAEIMLPYEGRYIFENKEISQKHHIQNVESIRYQYQEKINHHIDQITQLCKKHNFFWVLHSTDMPIRDTLFKVWSMCSIYKSNQRSNI
jgi:uncharacterized protein (DUF58 family)